MKKNFKYALLGAIALTGAVSFSACQSSDEIVDNPNYNPETNTVKTEFTISIPNSGGQATRMDADGAPNNGVFKGIKEIKLYPITTITDGKATAASTMLTPITLDDISAFDQQGGNNNFNGKVYEDVAVPLGTKAFLFYGEITEEKGGGLTPTYPALSTATGTPADVHFELEPIQSATFSSVSSNTQGAAVLAALNEVVGVLSTKESSSADLNELLQSFKALKAGSANSVKAFMENAYKRLTSIGGDDAGVVKAKIEEYFTVESGTLTWKTTNTFPNNIGLPDGAIGVNYNSSTAENPFSFANVAAGGNAQPELTLYVKPASLFYTVNTPVKTSDAAQVANYASKTNWDGVVGLYTDTEVRSSTRGIVLVNPIQYGVGRLKSQVQLATTSLKANDGNNGEATVTPPTEGYTVSGILIGGQKNVDWKFEPPTEEQEAASPATSYTIYDPVQTGGENVKATTTPSTANYTLALQTAKDAEIKVVVELVNDGDDFYGIEDRLIPAGSKFYLIAKLKPSESGTYNANNDTKNRVFCQDVETSVTFTIGTESLKKAYNTIPDLRAAKMELGLSVDLNWTEGLTFTPTLGN